MTHSTKLILGSQSPRRRDLLENVGFQFEVKSIDHDEVFPDDMPVEDVAEFLAIEKNRAFREQLKDETVLTADTVVISKDRILGKPKNKVEAINMLSALSGNSHSVVTGVCISNDQNRHSLSSSTQVKIKTLSINEINHYVSKFEPFDKAGAYGIQEWFGLIAVEWIKGSFYNVVGLPIHEVYDILTEEFSISPY
ncbi:MAG: Maf family nucleotide pyrophosphatase [Cyclobacteriaceae bacterium]